MPETIILSVTANYPAGFDKFLMSKGVKNVSFGAFETIIDGKPVDTYPDAKKELAKLLAEFAENQS